MEQSLCLRRSPVKFPAQAEETAVHGGFRIVRSFLAEGDGPHLVDLSHLTKWDLQSRAIRDIPVATAGVPAEPGRSLIKDGIVVNRLSATQASIWDIGAAGLDLSAEPGATDVTDATCLLAILGSATFEVMERLSSLDLTAPGRTFPAVLQGPVLGIPSQVVVINTTGPRAVFLAFSRGYGQSLAEAVLERGSRLGLRCGGYNRFEQLLRTLALV